MLKQYFALATVVIALVVLVSCSERSDTLYEKLSTEQTGIEFAKKLVYSDTPSVLDFEYLFNGRGVAVGMSTMTDFWIFFLPEI